VADRITLAALDPFRGYATALAARDFRNFRLRLLLTYGPDWQDERTARMETPPPTLGGVEPDKRWRRTALKRNPR
jgi:hypothetical protein